MPSQSCPDPAEPFSGTLARARGGDCEAFGDLVKPVERVLRRRASRLLSKEVIPSVGSSDVAQTSLMEAQQHLADFQGATFKEFCAWLFSILDHRVLDANRHVWVVKKRRADAEQSRAEPPLRALIAPGPAPDELAVENEERLRLQQAIAGLSEDERAIIRLRFQEQQSWAEVAGRLGSSVNAARMRCARLLQRLCRVLRRETEG